MPDYGHSLQLDIDTWDLTLDQGGDIAQCGGDYAVAQDVSNRIRIFTDDAYFDPEQGIPHFAIDLGVRASAALVRSRYQQQALLVPGVTSAQVIDVDTENRELHGDVRITTANGGEADVSI